MNEEEGILLTVVGHKKLEEELHHLSTVRRHEIAEQIRESKEHGEFGEDNAEFESAKFDLAMVESRISDLRQILAEAIIVGPDDIPTDYVSFGSIVKVKDLDSECIYELTLVGPLEADPEEDKISIVSPVGDALLECQVGDEVTVTVPAGKLRYRIEEIRK